MRVYMCTRMKYISVPVWRCVCVCEVCARVYLCTHGWNTLHLCSYVEVCLCVHTCVRVHTWMEYIVSLFLGGGVCVCKAVHAHMCAQTDGIYYTYLETGQMDRIRTYTPFVLTTDTQAPPVLTGTTVERQERL